jgi:hypothetical protein
MCAATVGVEVVPGLGIAGAVDELLGEPSGASGGFFSTCDNGGSGATGEANFMFC